MPILPPSFAELLAWLRPCFTAPTFATFTALCYGFLAQTGRRTVTGMLLGARLSQVWSHHRAHRCFSRACWSADQLGLHLTDLIVRLLIHPDAPIPVAVDDTLMRRHGRKIHGAAWHHDPLAAGRQRTAWATAGSWPASSWICRSCRTARCACRSWPACGGPRPQRANRPSPASWSTCSPIVS
jgi:DDE superfamily endonuclease